MVNLRESYPNGFAVAIACATAAFGYVVMATGFGPFGAHGASIAMRTTYIAAVCLLMFDVIESAHIARGTSRDRRNPYVWIYAFYMGYFWCLMMMLMFWRGAENIGMLLVQWGVAGAGFGLWMAFFITPPHGCPSGRFDLDNPPTDRPLGRLYIFWPIILVILITALVSFPPDTGWRDGYLLFQMIFLGSMMPLYNYAKPLLWRAALPRLIGFTLLLIGLLAF